MMQVFVYGTLRTGMYNYEKYFQGHVVHRQKGYVKGELYSIIDKVYPALIPGERMILGELMDMDDTFSVEIVDEMEGYYGPHRLDNEYHKMMCTIYDLDKTTEIGAFPVYMYNLDNPHHLHTLGQIIEENDYVTYQKKKRELLDRYL